MFDELVQHQSTLLIEKMTENAAALLVEITGPEPVHIEMSARGPAKYYEVKRPFTLQDARDHLAGKKTRGALLRQPDGKTRALCYDADTDDDWQRLLEAAHFLASAGYTSLVEDSPAGRTKDGQGWIDFGASARRTTGKQGGGAPWSPRPGVASGPWHGHQCSASSSSLPGEIAFHGDEF